MREPLRDKERLAHMLAAADRVIRYTSDKTFEDLKADDMMYYAVVKNIEIIGEAAISYLLNSSILILPHLGSKSEACVITLYTNISR